MSVVGTIPKRFVIKRGTGSTDADTLNPVIFKPVIEDKTGPNANIPRTTAVPIGSPYNTPLPTSFRVIFTPVTVVKRKFSRFCPTNPEKMAMTLAGIQYRSMGLTLANVPPCTAK